MSEWVGLVRCGFCDYQERYGDPGARVALAREHTLVCEKNPLREELRRQQASLDLVLEDLAALLRALGMGDHARPISPHEVMLQCIREVERLRMALRRYAATCTWPHREERVCPEHGWAQAALAKARGSAA